MNNIILMVLSMSLLQGVINISQATDNRGRDNLIRVFHRELMDPQRKNLSKAKHLLSNYDLILKRLECPNQVCHVIACTERVKTISKIFRLIKTEADEKEYTKKMLSAYRKCGRGYIDKKVMKFCGAMFSLDMGKIREYSNQKLKVKKDFYATANPLGCIPWKLRFERKDLSTDYLTKSLEAVKIYYQVFGGDSPKALVPRTSAKSRTSAFYPYLYSNSLLHELAANENFNSFSRKQKQIYMQIVSLVTRKANPHFRIYGADPKRLKPFQGYSRTYSPIMLASCNGNYEILEYLLKQRGNPNGKTEASHIYGYTALDLAYDARIKRLLKKYKARSGNGRKDAASLAKAKLFCRYVWHY